MERIRALWNRGLLGKATLIGGGTLGLLVLCCVALLLFVPRPPRTGQNATAAPGAPTAAAGPTGTPAPTDTPAPPTPPPPTPAPTETPSPIPPTETPVPPVELSGTGQSVTDKFTPPGGINRVFLTHKGRSNFIVHVFSANGDEDTVVNEIGNYTGVRPLVNSDGPYFFEIKADGPWTIRVESIAGEPEAAQGLEGSGDYVSGVFAPATDGAVPYDVSHDGERNFIVHLYCAGGEDSVQNEIGKVSGSVVVRFDGAPCFWDVRADGNWSLKPK